ncbi:hypothetical protein HanXRQr2_Chr09g0372501 [Helianthus annuus]|nr:hypothetical protein HanXRQr2_Chr09g0372501 [Helianthus annuus]KAJ0891851.1 hypothetical protein HanPSC8_Chr09g0359011 [Helianthus annuus]
MSMEGDSNAASNLNSGRSNESQKRGSMSEGQLYGNISLNTRMKMENKGHDVTTVLEIMLLNQVLGHLTCVFMLRNVLVIQIVLLISHILHLT